jgi:hypothetical protein
VEIDPLCIPSFDRSCLRFVIALQHPCVSSRVSRPTAEWPWDRAPPGGRQFLAPGAAVQRGRGLDPFLWASTAATGLRWAGPPPCSATEV